MASVANLIRAMIAIDLVFHVDTTGSMGYLREELRRMLIRDAEFILREFPGIRVAVIFFGDDSNRNEVYPVKVLPLTSDVQKVIAFIAETPNTYGGGEHANNERALAEANRLDWRPEANRIVCHYGDEVPHPANFKHNDGSSYDWQQELKVLADRGVKIYAIQCLAGSYGYRYSRDNPADFYRALAERSGGKHLHLDQFRDMGTVGLAAVLLQKGIEHVDALRERVKNSGGMSKALNRNFADLTGGTVDCTIGQAQTAEGLVGMPIGQFQFLQTDEEISLPAFLQKHGIDYHGVLRFYEVSSDMKKNPLVQDNKAVVLRHRVTGEFFTGDKAAEMIGLPPRRKDGDCSSKRDVTIYPKKDRRIHEVLVEYQIFIESTSNNRVLYPGDHVLVDVYAKSSSRARGL